MSNQPKSALEEFFGLSGGRLKVIFAWLNCERLKVVFLGIIAFVIITMFVMFILGIQKGIGLGRYQVVVETGYLIKIDTYTGKMRRAVGGGKWVAFEEEK